MTLSTFQWTTNKHTSPPRWIQINVPYFGGTLREGEKAEQIVLTATHSTILLAHAVTRRISRRKSAVAGTTEQQGLLERLHVCSTCLIICLGCRKCMLHNKTIMVKYSTFSWLLRHILANYLMGESLWKLLNVWPVNQKCEFGKLETHKVLLMSTVRAVLLLMVLFKPAVLC